MAEAVEIWTDGACLGNPGPGGYAAVLKLGKHEREVVGGEAQTTNNRMELMAVISALEALKRPVTATVSTDSKYVIGGITEWMPGWIRKGWKKVKNRDLWERLAAAVEPHELTWRWVRGHAGDVMNERCDALATEAARQQKITLGHEEELRSEAARRDPRPGHSPRADPSPSRGSPGAAERAKEQNEARADPGALEDSGADADR